MVDILETLIKASKRAAAIARSCYDSNESLLVAEKGDREANARFDKDFKTIVDVLAQESARALIAERFPELGTHVKGEESAEIGGVCIKLLESPDETAQLLQSLVPPVVAKRLADAAHSHPDYDKSLNIPSDLPHIDPADLGIWIDPIDATAEFIAGVCGDAGPESGLPCVTVLIGAYLRSTGEPVIGVINQPFCDDKKDHILWGFCYGGTKKWGGSNLNTAKDNRIILMSSTEVPGIIDKLKASGWDMKSLPGAGHKLMKVALGDAAAYIVSKGTTYRWDTCAPHAILKAQGGNVLCYTTHNSITYNDEHTDIQKYCNSDGIIAYKKSSVFEDIKEILKNPFYTISTK